VIIAENSGSFSSRPRRRFGVCFSSLIDIMLISSNISRNMIHRIIIHGVEKGYKSRVFSVEFRPESQRLCFIVFFAFSNTLRVRDTLHDEKYV
jgi:hypothetical protein